MSWRRDHVKKLAALFVTVVFAGSAGLAAAQTQTPPAPAAPAEKKMDGDKKMEKKADKKMEKKTKAADTKKPTPSGDTKASMEAKPGEAKAPEKK
jgi:hypothetical protein